MNNRISILFAGASAGYPGMGQTFYSNYEVFRSVVAEASDILNRNILSEPSQVAIYAVSVGMYRVFESAYGLIPVTMLGHGLGEISAATCSGEMNFTEGLRAALGRIDCGDDPAWGEKMRSLSNHQIDLAIEMGPGSMLKDLSDYFFDEIPVLSFDEESDRQLLHNIIGSIRIRKNEDIAEECKVMAASLPNNKAAARDAILQQEMKMAIGKMSEGSTIAQCREYMEQILACKAVDSCQIRDIMKRLFHEKGN